MRGVDFGRRFSFRHPGTMLCGVELVDCKEGRMQGARVWWIEWRCVAGILHSKLLHRPPLRSDTPVCRGHKKRAAKNGQKPVRVADEGETPVTFGGIQSTWDTVRGDPGGRVPPHPTMDEQENG